MGFRPTRDWRTRAVSGSRGSGSGGSWDVDEAGVSVELCRLVVHEGGETNNACVRKVGISRERPASRTRPRREDWKWRQAMAKGEVE